MIGYIYKTTNLLNQKTYIGQHKANKFDDKYLGSGVYLTNAINKYGKENFKVEFICAADTLKELDELEQYYISNLRKNGKCEYNIAAGGQYSGGWCWIKKDDTVMQVLKEHLDNYISAGWEMGRSTPIHNVGKIGVHKDGVNKYILEEELSSYLYNGWEEGFLINYKVTSTEGLMWIHNDKGEKHMVTPEERVTKYKDWKDGIGNHSNNGVSTKYIKDSIWIHKGTERKRISKEDRSKYIDWEDGIGSVKPRQKQVWINNGEIQRYVYESNLDNYPGWNIGKLNKSSN